MVDQTDHAFKATAVAWPKAAKAAVSAPAPGTGRMAGAKAQAVGTPVWVQRLTPAARPDRTPGATGSTSDPSATPTAAAPVLVSVQSHGAAQKLGVSGVVFTVSGSGDGGRLQVGLDYSAFAQAFGGNYAQRLRLVELPACALTTPAVTACQRQTPLASTIDPASTSISAPVTLPSAGQETTSADPATRTAAGEASPLTEAPAAPLVIAMVSESASTGSGGAGTYAATSLSPSSSWTTSGNSGSWDYSYSLTMPNSSTSLQPSADLSYDSGSLDGQTSSTQAQSSWLGDGWSTASNSVSQTFTSCSDDPEGSASPTSTDDQCYDGKIFSLTLNGSSNSIIYDTTSKTYKLANADGDTVTYASGTDNGSGSYDSGYWIVTTRQGIQYEFGRNELPGWKSGSATTHSVDTQPVYSAHSGDPCYSSSGFTSSVCTMAYQWHLDYVVAPDKSAMAYYYDQATNYYGEDNGAHNVSYVRDSYLDHVDYGFQDGGAYGTVPDSVVYGTSARCVQSTCDPISTSNAGTEYPDVPEDLACASGATCSQYSPSYYSTVRLTSITTEQYSATDKKSDPVDTYTFAQTEPATGDGTSPTLWLASITHTGNDTTAGGSTTAQTTPSVTFTGVDLANRVDISTYVGLYRYRIASVTTETGGVISVTYSLPDACTATSIKTITPSSNTSSCYPVNWTPQDYTAQIQDWFNKYAVHEVTESDSTGAAPSKETDYTYNGGAAWHYDDNELVKAKYRTYGQFRGYAGVETTTGNGNSSDPKTKSVTTYYQGMDGDWLSSSSTRSVQLTDSQGGKHTDSDELAGDALETTGYLGDGGPITSSTIESYWVSPALATRTRAGLPPVTSNESGPAEEWSRTADTDGGTTTWQVSETDTSYDTTTSDADFGLPLYVYSHSVPANTAYDQCSATTYAPANTSANIVGLPAQTEADSVACSGFTEGSVSSVPGSLNTLGKPSAVTADQVISADRTFYDDATFSAAFPQVSAPAVGLVTMTQRAATGTPGSFTWQTKTRTTYDKYAQAVDVYDGDNNHTHTATTYNSVGLVTARTVTNAQNQTTTATYDPTRELQLTAQDPNGVTVTEHYDALGRITAVWQASRATTAPANILHTYTLSNTSVSGTTTQTLNDSSHYVTSVTVEDALGRTRETQTATAKGGRLVTDTFYDSRGWIWKTDTNVWDPSTPPTLGTPYDPQDSQVDNQDRLTLDGLGRTVVDTSLQDSVVKAATTTVYNGDTTTVFPPTGGTVTSTTTDPVGRTKTMAQYSTAPALVAPADTFNGIWYTTGGTADTTTYGYDAHNNQNSITNAGSTWSSTFNDDLAEVTSKADPDAGATTGMQYDNDGNLTQSTDARGNTTSTTYDVLGRKTATFNAATSGQVKYTSTTSPGNQTAAYVYDNSNNVAGIADSVGQLTTQTAYDNVKGTVYPFVEQSLGYNVFGESLGTSVTVPSALSATLGKTWTVKHAYSTTTGLLASDTYPAGGGQQGETVNHTYETDLDLPNGLSSTAATYSYSTDYNALGNVDQETLGSGSNQAFITNTYDPHTDNLTQQLVSRTTSPTAVDDESYTYNAAGQLTAQTDERAGQAAQSETQCYAYDTQDRLSGAWTATDNCAADPATNSGSTVGDGLGTASSYWTTWTFKPTGERDTETDHATAATAATATSTTSSTYNGNGNGQAHTLTGTSTTSSSGSSITSYSYDADGDMTGRTTPSTGAETFTWNPQGQLTAVTGSTNGDASYLYDASGSMLVQTDGATTTLYLPGEQISDKTANGTTSTTAVRYYTLPGGGTVVRTAPGINYEFELSDQHGTNDLYLDYTAQTPTWRQLSPYGAPRGTTVTWVDNRGFLNQPTDTSTGLTIDGARQYDPTTGSFISLDPVFEATDTQELNGYSYSGNNPVGGSDPTGTMECDDNGCGGHKDITNDEKKTAKKQKQDRDAAKYGYYWSPYSNSYVTKAILNQQEAAYEAQLDAIVAAQEKAAEQAAEARAKATHHSWLNRLEGAALDIAEQAAPIVIDVVVDGVLEVATDGAATPALLEIDEAIDAGIEGVEAGAEAGEEGAAAAADETASGADDAATDEPVSDDDECSFAPSTPVLMAGGKTEPIGSIKPGQKVASADPTTGKPKGSRTVLATWVNHDTDLVDVTIQTGNTKPAVIHTTANHPFYDQTTQSFTPGGKLRPGDHLATTKDNQHPLVLAVSVTPGAAERDNLTVEQLHTYYVMAAGTPILVHNASCKVVKENDGGRFGDLSPGPPGDGLTAHHMPQDAMHYLDRNEGGSVVMTQADHELTRTYSGRGGVTKIQDAGLPFRQVLAMDLWDMRRIGQLSHGDPGYFNKGISQMMAYYRRIGML
ncbi:polymorphic toxin-type HINT domain-containing protein [Streptacidiphilus sp. N1-3]|uniref:Polymorphic toxin-type HINT domain-containing protein n=1 Tax=Streptacidiphilus alkalitolerans TaxID=3342712 RepID=A0ABV6X2Y9_9ACTN